MSSLDIQALGAQSKSNCAPNDDLCRKKEDAAAARNALLLAEREAKKLRA